MKAQVVSVLVAIAALAGAGLGYFGGSMAGNATTETIVTTYTRTFTLPQGWIMQCVVTEYTIRAFESIGSSTTSFGTTTQSSEVQTYQTTTSVSQTVGRATTFTMTPTTTQTGERTWNSTV